MNYRGSTAFYLVASGVCQIERQPPLLGTHFDSKTPNSEDHDLLSPLLVGRQDFWGGSPPVKAQDTGTPSRKTAFSVRAAFCSLPAFSQLRVLSVELTASQ